VIGSERTEEAIEPDSEEPDHQARTEFGIERNVEAGSFEEALLEGGFAEWLTIETMTSHLLERLALLQRTLPSDSA
jgi:hypothetical protein